MKKIGLISLGCAKNRIDAELMLHKLKSEGFEITNDACNADAVIINTCGFIESAKKESIAEILEIAKLKSEGRVKAIIVTGCLAERYKDEVMKELPEVDAVIGIGANSDIAGVVKKALCGEVLQEFPDKALLPLDGERVLSTPRYYAYLKIADGCDNCCSYCAIPLIRGCFRSRSMESIVKEAEKLADHGVKELLVIAQDTTRYGEDIYGKLMLPELLKKLSGIDKIRWIRLLYCYPDRITDELIDVISLNEKILKYIDIPLQHCSAGILKAMNRTGSRQSLTELIEKLRSRIPGIVLRTTLITGFPGETEQDFTELSEFVNEIKFERLGCFAYSAEEDTKAALMSCQHDDEEKLRRQEIIMSQQQRIMEEYCRSLEGKTLDVLTEGFDRFAGCFYGRAYTDAPEVDGKIFFTYSGIKPHEGDIVKVKITGCLDYDPLGETVG